MHVVTLQEAGSDLASLVERAAGGEQVVITEDGKPRVKVVAVDPPDGPAPHRRLGFLAGQIAVPDDFDRMGDAAIDGLFGGT